MGNLSYCEVEKKMIDHSHYSEVINHYNRKAWVKVVRHALALVLHNHRYFGDDSNTLHDSVVAAGNIQSLTDEYYDLVTRKVTDNLIGTSIGVWHFKNLCGSIMLDWRKNNKGKYAPCVCFHLDTDEFKKHLYSLNELEAEIYNYLADLESKKSKIQEQIDKVVGVEREIKITSFKEVEDFSDIYNRMKLTPEAQEILDKAPTISMSELERKCSNE